MAVAVGSSKVQVTRDVATILDELTKSNHEAAERWQAVAVERLQQLVSVWWDAADNGWARMGCRILRRTRR